MDDRLRRRVFERDNWTCRSCGRRGGPKGDTVLQVHHVVPRSEGGTDDFANLATVCDRCHGTLHGTEYLRTRRRRSRTGAPRRGRRRHRVGGRR